MTDPMIVILELGAVFLFLGIAGAFANRIGLSPIPLYLLAGLTVGQGGFTRLSEISDFTHIAAEIGVILLLLLLGIEYNAHELIVGLRKTWRTGFLDLVLNGLPGVAIALLFGWGPVGALVMFGVTSVSSSGVVAKGLSDLGRLGNRETPVVLSLLVFEDLAMAVYLPVLTAMLAGVAVLVEVRSVVMALLVAMAILFIAVRYSNMISRAISSTNKESFLLKLLGTALLVAGFASEMQVSAAVGAFLLGIAISGTAADEAAKILEPLRDLFAAIFFVVFGLTTDPGKIPGVLGWALLLVVVTTITKILTGILAARSAGIGEMGQLRAGVSMVAHGEFSIIVAGLAVTAGRTSPELSALAATYVLFMAIIGPILMRVVEPVGLRTLQFQRRYVQRKMS